jgi:hypothetical protein
MSDLGLGKRFPVVVIFLATIFLAACEQSKPTVPAPAVAPPQILEKAFVLFEGPWAFALDPQNANQIVAIAPKTKMHRDLYVKASNEKALAPGIYELLLPTHTGTAAATTDPDIAQVKVDPQKLQRALDSKSVRYVIRLPKPEEYRVASRSKSRVDAKYPPDASTEKDYASAVSLRYNVASLDGFSFSGTPDTGNFGTLPLRVETPIIRFAIDPTQDDDPNDKCDTHSRESFSDLVSLLGLTLYVDFPDNPDYCHAKDPQMIRAKSQAEATTRLETLAAVISGKLVDADAVGTNIGGDSLLHFDMNLRRSLLTSARDYLAVALYFFTRPAVDCRSPDLILTPIP